MTGFHFDWLPLEVARGWRFELALGLYSRVMRRDAAAWSERVQAARRSPAKEMILVNASSCRSGLMGPTGRHGVTATDEDNVPEAALRRPASKRR